MPVKMKCSLINSPNTVLIVSFLLLASILSLFGYCMYQEAQNSDCWRKRYIVFSDISANAGTVVVRYVQLRAQMLPFFHKHSSRNLFGCDVKFAVACPVKPIQARMD